VSAVDSIGNVVIQLDVSDLRLLLGGLDAHEYWQLGDVLPRNDGLVFLPDDDGGSRYWPQGTDLSEEQRQAIDSVRTCRALAERLRAVLVDQDEHDPLVARYQRLIVEYAQAVDALVPALIEMALAKVAEVLPGTATLDVLDETNEDWVPILRVRRVHDAAGVVLYDAEHGHPDRGVEARIDEVGSEYLDLLLDLTGDDFVGPSVIAADPSEAYERR
jgi:hypothetical protein